MEEKNIKKEVMKNKTDLHLKRFDELFGTKTRHRIKAMPLFRAYFDRFKNELYEESEDSKRLKEKREDLRRRLEISLTEEQKELLDQYIKMEETINIELEKQLFLFGCISSMEMKTELNESD